MTEACDAEARRIYQDVLDRMNQAYFDGDLGVYRQLVHLPFTLSTFDSKVELTTPDEVGLMFRNLRLFLSSKNITSYIRVCIAARFLDPDTIEGTHEQSSWRMRANRNCGPAMPPAGRPAWPTDTW